MGLFGWPFKHFIIFLIENASDEGKELFKKEIEFMSRVGFHRNILNMIGYWTRSEPIMLLLEYVPHGDLLQWLRKRGRQVTEVCCFNTALLLKSLLFCLKSISCKSIQFSFDERGGIIKGKKGKVDSLSLPRVFFLTSVF